MSGLSVRLKPVPLQSLSELERVRLQEVAFSRLLQDHDLGCQITIPKGSLLLRPGSHLTVSHYLLIPPFRLPYSVQSYLFPGPWREVLVTCLNITQQTLTPKQNVMYHF